MRARLSGTVENPDAVWTSGDATLTKMAGVNWRGKEFFQLAPSDLLADFHQGQLRAYNIGEVELMTAVGITVFWADIWKVRQIILLGTDNQNTFSWLDGRSAKKRFGSTSGCNFPRMVCEEWNRSISFLLAKPTQYTTRLRYSRIWIRSALSGGNGGLYACRKTMAAVPIYGMRA